MNGKLATACVIFIASLILHGCVTPADVRDLRGRVDAIGNDLAVLGARQAELAITANEIKRDTENLSSDNSKLKDAISELGEVLASGEGYSQELTDILSRIRERGAISNGEDAGRIKPP